MTILDPRLWLGFIIALALTAGGCYFKGHTDGVKVTQAAAQKAQLAAVTAARTEEQRRTAAQSEIANEAARQRSAALGDAFAARAAADGLRKQVAALLSRAQHPTPSAGSPPAGDPIGVLADVLESADERAGRLAEIADERGIAGQQCERDYDALNHKENSQ
ncbi:DUF2514 domain-containing protein [Burkholderia gladioli]|uniref:DUF2514 domain-containing protein n=1 Tax=Burkholderia gladioli TaxID=28095 RepID=A0AB38U668_BURGA|nr:DUF2514 domain-containing protein [Burkholderia gladioli]UWX75382.1 DUF2514 domain-containing protein [Burkholderia gladioli]